MKAVVYTQYGPPSVMRVQNVKKPVPQNNEVLIEVCATTVNRTDCGLRGANYFVSRFFTGLFRPKKQITGTEFAGKITQIGSSVTDYKVGDRVFGFHDTRFGAHAEYKTEPANGPMAKIPKGFTYKQVAPATEGATYALSIIKAAGVKRGQKVMVYGASGAIGSAAVQILKDLDAHVVAVCGTKNTRLIRSLGADKVIDYEKQDFTATKEKFDLVFDAVGKSSYGACKHLLKPTGAYCSTELGPKGQNPLLAIWFAITGSKKVLFPIPKITKENTEYIRKLLEKGTYKPVIDRTYKLDEIVEAATYVETGQKTGNVIVLVR